MPEIARFFGIIITIYMEVEEVHQIPHFHARYGEYHASYSIDPDHPACGSAASPSAASSRGLGRIAPGGTARQLAAYPDRACICADSRA